MPAFIDVNMFTVRAGTVANSYGDDWRCCTTGVVQHDRRVYLAAISGELHYRDLADIIRKVRQAAPAYGWREILWTRERKDGSVHLARISIKPLRGEPSWDMQQ